MRLISGSLRFSTTETQFLKETEFLREGFSTTETQFLKETEFLREGFSTTETQFLKEAEIMEKLTLSSLSKATLKRLVNLEERDFTTLEWLQVDSISLTTEEQQQVQFVQSRLHRSHAHLMNEATLCMG